MAQIKTFAFNKGGFDEIREDTFGRNWPVVYLIEDGKELYIGETINAYSRSNQHYDNAERERLDRIHIIADEEYNKSATLDIESSLIQYMSADSRFVLQNGNKGLSNHNYYDRQRYQAKFEIIWGQLKKLALVKKDLVQIKNSELFKYSPFKALTDDQLEVAERLLGEIQATLSGTIVVNGGPGTGKTILATYLVKALKSEEKTKDLKVGFVVPMTSLRQTLKNVFKDIKGLKSSMVIGPNEAARGGYDILIVDEAHRLKRRKNITNYQTFDITNKKLKLDNTGTELDWILQSAPYRVLFYDQNQSVRPSDIKHEKIAELSAKRFELRTQMRIGEGNGGEEYIGFIESLFDITAKGKTLKKSSYDFRIFDDIHEMVADIKRKDLSLGLCRVVSGYAWPWVSKKNPDRHDIEIDGLKLFWNSVNHNWVNSKNAINEVGCIHTVQGYDLNYAGVIIGPELSFDKEKREFVIHTEKYRDINGRRGVDSPEELKRYIINIYKTLLTRGILGTYVFIVDKDLREFFKSRVEGESRVNKRITLENILPPKVQEIVDVPLVGSVPCGAPLFAEENIEEMIPVEKKKLQGGAQYFILRASGDSMNDAKHKINDGDLLLCKQKLTARENDLVVALIDGEATVKEFHREGNKIMLKPRSTNPEYQPRYFTEGEDFKIQGIVQEVVRLFD